MKKYIVLVFIIIVVAFTVNDVQKEFITLNWQEQNNLNLLESENLMPVFENAGFSEDEFHIPVYSKIFDLKNENQGFRFVLENETFEEFNLNDKAINLGDLPLEIELKTVRLKSAKQLKLQLQFIPIVKKNNKYFLLKSFELRKIPVKIEQKSIANHSWSNESVLKTGKWVKISTQKKGIYKIPYSKLTEWGFSNPAQVKVFGSGGILLSENPGEINYDDLNQNAVWHDQNSGENCLFFYAAGLVKWELDNANSNFEHYPNDYATKGFFFLTEEGGTNKTVEVLSEVLEPATHQLNTFDEYTFYELDKYNLLHSGKQWFGDKFINGSTKKFVIDIKDVDNSAKVKVRVNAAARSYQASQMAVSINQSGVEELSFFNVNTGDPTSVYANERDKKYSLNIQNNTVDVSLNYKATNENAEAWLDFIEVNYRRKLKLNNEVLFFRDINSVNSGNLVEFSVENASSATKLLDVTDLNNVKQIPVQLSGNTIKAKRPSNELREYAIFNTNGTFPEPELIGEVENQNLHALSSPELLIITHENYLNSSNSLADFHRSYDGMSVEVVEVNKVYNEYSSGSANATGIRNFIKMFYDRDDNLKYVLLMGDGSYDNKNINQTSNNFIPTFQSRNSLNPVASFITDDYFIMLDNDESVYSGAIDLGIGRIPASSNFEAELVVDKIRNYYSAEALGDWRNVVCFIADDEDGSLHMSDSEKLSKQVNDNHKEFVTDKIYFDAFLQEATPAGERYPGVTEAINNRVKDGVLVLNYVGHANARFLADEHVLDVSNINSWSNSKTLPIFVTATCEFSRFDADDASAGEYILFNPNGGGIGLFSTTRVVFAYSNFLLSTSFYDYIFAKDENGDHYRMGDIMRLAKINTRNTTNKRNFSLLADPALKLSYPKFRVITSTINQQAATENPDTIASLQEITISGFVSDYAGNKLNGFSGQISPTVYDKEIVMKTLGNGGENPMDFKVQENIIYKGLASVTNGDFSFSFVVPKDISYKLGEGKVVYYASDEEIDAHGAFENFYIGGSSDAQITDNQGPDVQLFIDSPDFKTGDKTSKNPTLLAFLSDENGINTVGTGIGHDITAILDDDYSNVLVLNNYYQSDINDYTSGKVLFPLKNLSVGIHKLKLKAWDVANNSTETEIEFQVSGEFSIEEISNYPNPVIDYTFFTFKHNQSDANLDAIIEIFDQSGRRIEYISTQISSNGTNSNPVRWDLNDSEVQLGSGIYIYRVIAQNNDGVITSKSGKMIVAR